MFHSSWSRRGVDGRVKPGHDDEGPRRSRKKARPTAIAIRARHFVDRIRNKRQYSHWRNRRARPQPGEEKPQLFENLPDHNPPGELEAEADFSI
jgi:hypothetical protein